MKIKHFRFALFLIVLMLLTLESCRKIIDSGPSSVKGTVVRKSDGKTSVPFATVSLLEKDKKGSIISAGTLETKIANENGEFSFDFDAEWGYDYAIIAQAENYYETSYPKYITAGKSRNVTFELQPFGFVKLRFINKEPGEVYNGVSIKEWCNDKIGLRINSFDTCITCKILAGSEAKISYWVQKSNYSGYFVNKNFYHYLYVPPLDTVQATIEY